MILEVFSDLNDSTILFWFYILCRDHPSLVCPHGWGKHQFRYEFQLQTWLRSSEHSEKRRFRGWTGSLICTNTHLPRMERPGRKCLVTHFDSHWSTHDTTAGIMFHWLLKLFLTIPHFELLCQNSVAPSMHPLLIPKAQAPSSASVIVLPFPRWYQPGYFSQQGCKSLPGAAHPACWLCSGGFTSQPPKQHYQNSFSPTAK